MSKKCRRHILHAFVPPSCGGNEEWRDWPNLPLGLIDDIAGRLLRYDMAEYIRLRAACKEWRKCTADPREGCDLDNRFRPSRWIMLSNRTHSDGRRFLNLTTGACARVDLLELSSHHLEASVEGLLLLRDKASHAVRLLNPITRALTELPPITAELGAAYTAWTGLFISARRTIYAGISDEACPPSVVLFMRDSWIASAIAYAKPGDERWAVMDQECCRSLRISPGCSSVSMLHGRIYFATPEGNILEARLGPRPELVPVVVNQPLNRCRNVDSFLVPPDDQHHSMLMVRSYYSLQHLSAEEQRRMKCRRKNRNVIRVEDKARAFRWQLIQVFEVNLARKDLLPVEYIGHHRAVFAGDFASFSLSTSRFPCISGNAVYLGVAGYRFPSIGVSYLTNKTMDPPFEFSMDDERHNVAGRELKTYRQSWPDLNLVPIARPCTLQEYLVCCAGLNGGLKD